MRAPLGSGDDGAHFDPEAGLLFLPPRQANETNAQPSIYDLSRHHENAHWLQFMATPYGELMSRLRRERNQAAVQYLKRLDDPQRQLYQRSMPSGRALL